eukprot:4791083-Pyramimonas_sp.AAC.1
MEAPSAQLPDGSSLQLKLECFSRAGVLVQLRAPPRSIPPPSLDVVVQGGAAQVVVALRVDVLALAAACSTA